MPIINYKNATLLRRYINRTRKIIPRRANGISPKDHRAIAKAIRQARGIRIIPFVRLTLLD
jgi:small subunit ribosomal protein S18